VEWHIILAHELNQLHVIRVLPPFLPAVGVTCCDGYVSNGGIEPHIKHLEKRSDKAKVTSTKRGRESDPPYL
jgi:hypothetical protein